MPLNYSQICRVCLKHGDLKHIFSKPLEKAMRISEKLMACTSVKMTEGDGLPSKICSLCISELDQAYNFKQKCEKSDASLRMNICDKDVIIESKGLTDKEKAYYILYLKSNADNDESEDLEKLLSDEPADTSIENNDHLYIKSIKMECEDETLETNIKQEDEEHFSEDENENINVSSVSFEYLEEEVNQMNIICTFCSKEFTSENELAVHILEENHTQNISQDNFVEGKPFMCHLCGACFTVERNLKRHIMVHTGDKPYKCHVCDKAYNRTQKLKEHLRIHTGEKPYICNICGARFNRKNTLNSHLKIHMKSEDDAEENQLDDSFKKRKYVRKKPYVYTPRVHTQQSNKPRSFLCTECGKGFTTKFLLQSHQRVHTGERPYVCNECGKSFSRPHLHQKHMRIHTGEKPYPCAYCGKHFRQHNHLTHHTRIHTGEKPYVCTVCGRGFTLNGNLTIHMRIHTGELPYVCDICKKGFRDSSSMNKHKRKHSTNCNVGERILPDVIELY